MNLGPHFSGFAGSLESILTSGVYRFCQTFLEAAPFLLMGILFAGLLRGMVGHGRLRDILGGGGLQGALRGWVLGIILPVCALGALPVARELRRAGLSTGTVLSFTIVAPVMNPVSVVYGLSHINIISFLLFLAGSLIISVALGAGWDRIFGRSAMPLSAGPDPVLQNSNDRVRLTFLNILRSSTGGVIGDLLLVVVFMGILGAILPYGILQSLFVRGSLLSPLIMGIFALPVYITPMEIMTQFEHVVRDGYSLGASFMLVILGAGANAGVINWIRRDYGLRNATLLIISFFVVTLAFSLLMEWSPWQRITGSTDHTHAFDSYTRLPEQDTAASTISGLGKSLLENSNAAQILGLCFLVMLMAGSTAVDRLMMNKAGGLDAVIDSFFNRAAVNAPREEKRLPVPLVAGCGIILALAGGYTFGRIIYDAPDLTIIRMGDVRGELTQAILFEKKEDIAHHLDQLDFLADQLNLGYLIRYFSLPKDAAGLPGEYRRRIQVCREFLSQDDLRAVKNLMGYLYETHRQVQSAYNRR